MSQTQIDPIRLGVLWQRTVFLMDEVAQTLIQTSFSSVIRENFDFACVLFDAKGRLMAQSSVSIPAFCGTVQKTLRYLLADFPSETLSPGDVLLTNDPDAGTGHLNDLTFAMPIFRGGDIVGYAANVAHQTDIGGAVSPLAREIFEEGLQIPPVKILADWHDNRDVFAFLRRNVRDPAGTLGDVRAQIAALDTQRRKTLALLDEQGLDSLDDLADQIIERSAEAMRRKIRELLPDGVYDAEAFTDGFEDPLRLKLRITVKDGEVICDYTGSSPQIDKPVNCVLNYTRAYTAYAFKCLLDPELPNNDGSFDPIKVIAPEGSIVNPRPPAAVWSRHITGTYLPSVVFGALSGVLPDRVIADCGSPSWGAYFQAKTERGSRLFLYFMAGGHGGRPGLDGPSCLSFPTNVQNTSVEETENALPVLVCEKELLPDTGGPGHQRGGLGQRVTFEVQQEGVSVAFRHERVRFAPRGFLGGMDGARGANLLNGEPVPAKSRLNLRRGDRLTFLTPGGGGMGDPTERSRADLAQDVRNGYVDQDSAAKYYGYHGEEQGR